MIKVTTHNGQDTFSQVIPIHLVKGKNQKEGTAMKMRGIASTSDEDDDGEFLDPEGFDLNYFLKYGFMNWNHQATKDPTALIGKPTAASIDKSKRLVIDFDLFPDSQKAKDVYELQKVLESQGLALGLSIEGDVIERGSVDKNHPDFKKVKKARITGCAVCPNAKNAKTIATIIKGNKFTSLSAYEEEEDDVQEKALGMSNGTGSALAKESLDGDVKNIASKQNNSVKTMTKGMALKKIFLDLPTISPQIGESIYNLVETIQKSIHMDSNQNQQLEVSEEAITKAYQALGIVKSNEGTPIQEVPVETTTEVVAEAQTEVTTNEEVVTEVETEVIAETTQGTLTKEELMQKKQSLEKSLGEVTALLGAPVQEATEPVATTTINQQTTNVSDPELIKGITSLLKGHLEGFSSDMKERFAAVGQITKGLSDQMKDYQKDLDEIKQDLATPIRKSILTQQVVDKRFAGADEIQKSIESGDLKVMSLRGHKRQICDTLTKSITSTGEVSDLQLANDIMLFESAGQATDYLKAKAKENKIALIP